MPSVLLDSCAIPLKWDEKTRAEGMNSKKCRMSGSPIFNSSCFFVARLKIRVHIVCGVRYRFVYFAFIEVTLYYLLWYFFDLKLMSTHTHTHKHRLRHAITHLSWSVQNLLVHRRLCLCTSIRSVTNAMSLFGHLSPFDNRKSMLVSTTFVSISFVPILSHSSVFYTLGNQNVKSCVLHKPLLLMQAASFYHHRSGSQRLLFGFN